MKRVETHHSAGFTIVEMLVTVALAGIFLTFFIQMYRATHAQQQSLIRQSVANDIAKSNLAKFPTAASIAGATCDTSTSTVANTNNLKVKSDAPGTPVLAGHGEPNPDNLGTVTQTVLAYWPQGCGGNVPIKLISKVDYGFGGGTGGTQTNTVEYSTYVF